MKILLSPIYFNTQKKAIFSGKKEDFWSEYNQRLQDIPLKETIIKSINNEDNFLGEGRNKKGYNIQGLKNYVIRIYKANFSPKDLDKEFLSPEKTKRNMLDDVILCIPDKIDIVKKRNGVSVGVDNYANRIHIHQTNILKNIVITREESLKSLNLYEELMNFPLSSYKNAYSQIKKICKQIGFQFDIISPNNILVDVKSKKINIIDPVSPKTNEGVHGKSVDFLKLHGCDSLYPTLCDFLMHEEHLNNLNKEEQIRWQKAIGTIIAKCIKAGKLAGFERNLEQINTLYSRINKFWGNNELCKKYNSFLELYSNRIHPEQTIDDALNYKNKVSTRLNAIKKLDALDFNEIKPVFQELLAAPHQPKVEFPEILNATLDKISEYGKDAKSLTPDLEKLFEKEIFATTKQRLYKLFIRLEPTNKVFLKEIEKSSNNVFEKSLFRQEFSDLLDKSTKMPAKYKKIINQIHQNSLTGKILPKHMIDKLWISRTCVNTNSAQNVSLENMIKAYEYIEASKNRPPKTSDLIELHKIVLANTPGQEHIIGRLRTPDTDYIIGQIFKINKSSKKIVSDYSSSKEVVNDLKRLDEYITNNSEKEDSFKFAAELYNEIIRIHPFLNGNGRVTRLFIEQFLLSKGYRLMKWPEETLYRKIFTEEQIAESLKNNCVKIEKAVI